MSRYEDIITQAQKIISCPACGRTYAANEIKLRGFLDNTYILQTICSQGHSPLLTVFIASYQKKEEKISPAEIEALKSQRITSDDVIEFHQKIEKFDGNFESLWSQ